jgi:SAM-dependent methyltransferase
MAVDPSPHGPETYGQAIADLYDDWYGDVSDVEGTVELVRRLADGGPVLELGIGTGRIALPLAAAGVEVHGVDASAAMVEQLRAKPDGGSIPVLLGDFSQELPGVPGGFSVVFAAFNTFVNLTSDVAMANCLALVARQLRPGGALVLENALPADDPATSGVDARRVTPDQVVLSAFRRDGAVVHGSLIALSADGVRLCPWTVRLTPPEELAALASAAGFDEEARHGGWRNEPLNAGTTRYVVVFRLRRTTVA